MAREPDDTVKIRDAMRHRGVEYLVIGKMAAILQGFSDTTQDTDIFVESTPENNAKLIEALNDLGFDLDEELAATIRTGDNWVQLRGPVDIDIVFAPDGIERYEDARNRAREIDGHRVCALDDVIRSKEAANRQKDRESLPRLRNFKTFVDQQPPIGLKPLPRRPSPPETLFGTTPRQRAPGEEPDTPTNIVVRGRGRPARGKHPATQRPSRHDRDDAATASQPDDDGYTP